MFALGLRKERKEREELNGTSSAAVKQKTLTGYFGEKVCLRWPWVRLVQHHKRISVTSKGGYLIDKLHPIFLSQLSLILNHENHKA